MIAHFWGPGWLVGLAWFAFWVLVILLLVRAFSGGRAPRRAPRSSALQILEERYARGELSREEFLERRRVLSDTEATRPRPPPA